MSALSDVLGPLAFRQPLPDGWRWWPARFVRASSVYFVGGIVAAGIAGLMDRHAWEALAVAAVPLSLAYRVYVDHVGGLDTERRSSAALSHEVSEHRLAVQSMKRDADRLRLAAQVANDGLWEWDLQTQQFQVTGPWKALLGLPDSTAIESPAQWLDRVHRDDLAALKSALHAYLSGSSSRFQHEHRVRHEDGTYRRFLCRGWRPGRPAGARAHRRVADRHDRRASRRSGSAPRSSAIP